jgi:lipid A 3-O-deacylase
VKSFPAVLLLLVVVATAHGADLPPNFGLPFTDVRFGSVAFYSENDKYFAGTDQHYTNGFKVSALSSNLARLGPEEMYPLVRAAVRVLGPLIPDGQVYKLGVSLGQNLYTPVDTATAAFQPADRPYAAWLYVGTTLQIYQPPRTTASGNTLIARLDSLEVNLGMVGPAALGRQVQNNYHDLIKVSHARGWHHQIDNEPGIVVSLERKWRLSTAQARTGWGGDFIPHLGAAVGNVTTHANVGAEARLGWRLPADFGSNLIRPSGDSNSRQRANWSFFVFGGWDTRLVGRDITLDGTMFTSGPSIEKRKVVHDVAGGIALGSHHWQLAYTQARRSREFRGQDHSSVFGSISLTFYR